MPKFCANLTMLFTELDFLDRFAAAARAGFSGVEYLFPYVATKERVAEKLHQHGLKQVLHNFPAGNWEKGDRGIAVHPDRIGEYKESVDRAVEYANALGCKQLNCLAGIPPSGVSASKARETFVSNLKYAAPRLAKHGINLLIEPVNTFDIPGFFLQHTAQALAIIDEVGEKNIFLQYDIYHMQLMEGNLANTIAKNLARIAHVQLADVPGRHEPGTGEINFPFLFRYLDKIGYNGWIGCEYKPATTAAEGLGWMSSFVQESVSV